MVKANYQMKLHRLFNSTEGKLHLREQDKPALHQLQSTEQDNLIEYAGRTCFPKEVEVLTKNGWISIKDATVSTELLTFNRDIQELEYQKPTRCIKKIHKGKFALVDTKYAHICTTDDHDWYICDNGEWNLKPAKDLIGRKFYVKSAGLYKIYKSQEDFVIPEYAYSQVISNTYKKNIGISHRTSKGFTIRKEQIDDFAEFLGYYFSEGCVAGKNEFTNKNGKTSKSGLRVLLYQHINAVQPIRDNLKTLGWKFSEFLDTRNNVVQIIIYNTALSRYLLKYGKKAAEKFLPRECFEWSIKARRKLLNAYLYGDGGIVQNGTKVYSTNSSQMADDLQELIIKNGSKATINYIEPKFVIRECVEELTTINSPSNLLEMVDLEDKNVYCVSVPNRILVTRYKKFVTLMGNCYDSLGSEKSRSSPEYHQHINDVGHGSVQEHAWHTFQIESPDASSMAGILTLFAGRKGCYLSCDLVSDPKRLLISINTRAINEFLNADFWMKAIVEKTEIQTFHSVILDKIYRKVPLVLKNHKDHLIDGGPGFDIATGKLSDDHIFVSFLASEVSRGLTHELIRHRSISPSQRSTRYVDEGETAWSWHPLMTLTDSNVMMRGEARAQVDYSDTVNFLEKKQIDQGIDKFTARKQARGAARGFLGTALSTELVITDSVANWRNIFIKQRMVEAADMEICQLACLILRDLQKQGYLLDIKTRPHPSPAMEGFDVLV